MLISGSPNIACQFSSAFYKKNSLPSLIGRLFWYSRWESNPELTLRRGPLYPFNYGSRQNSFASLLYMILTKFANDFA